MDLADQAWLAGFFDGEGCVCVARSGARFTMKLSIANTNMETLDHVRRLLATAGIEVRIILMRSETAVAKAAYRIDVARRNDVLRLVEVLLPYSVTKRERLLLARRFAERRGTPRNPARFGVEDREIFEALRGLNTKGPSVAASVAAAA